MFILHAFLAMVTWIDISYPYKSLDGLLSILLVRLKSQWIAGVIIHQSVFGQAIEKKPVHKRLDR